MAKQRHHLQVNNQTRTVGPLPQEKPSEKKKQKPNRIVTSLTHESKIGRDDAKTGSDVGRDEVNSGNQRLSLDENEQPNETRA